MPGVSGVGVISALRADPQTARIPILAVTAFPMDRIRDSAYDAGCDGIIAKPFRNTELLQEIAKHLAMPAAVPKPPPK